MASGDYNLCITQGKPFNLSITVRGSDGDVLDLTDYTFTGHFKRSYGEQSPVLCLSETGLASVYSPLPISGQVSIFIPSSETSKLSVTKFIYDIEAHNNGSGIGDDVIELLRGRALVNPESTR